MTAAAPLLQIYSPPSASPITDESWRRWLSEVVWPLVGAGVGTSGPQGTFPQLQVGRARFTNENAFQELININQGIYATYRSNVENIIYGFACNVYRAAGGAFVVGAQINAINATSTTCAGVFGIACTADTDPFTGNCGLVGIEPDVASQSSTNTFSKIGIDLVFKDRGDGGATVTEGIGSNLYNYYTRGITLTSQARSSTGEFCGWNIGMDFVDGWCDTSSVLAWSGTVSYTASQIVSSGGVLWKAIQASLNQLPVAGSAYWVQRTAAGVVNLAVGIDFSSISVGTMARMASAIRLRSSQYFHWEETGSIGTKYDATTGLLHLCDNAGNVKLVFDAVNSFFGISQAIINPGGGAAATLGTVGGGGPAAAAQLGWHKIVLNGTNCYIPVWA